MKALRSALLFAIAALFAAPALAISADIDVTQSSGVAPLAVFFDARGTSDPNRNAVATFRDLSYEWDFGDGPCEATRDAWQHSGKSKCRDLGPLAGHVYETPGSYTATLTVSDGTQSDTKTIQITVTDPSQVFSGQKTVCISRNGDFTDPNGVCDNARRVTSGSNFGSLVSQHLAPGERMLLRRGDSWSGGSYSLGSNAETIIGAYGFGSTKPRINQGQARLVQLSGGSGLRLMDLAVDGSDSGSNGSVIFSSSAGQGSNTLVLRVDASDLPKPYQLQVNNANPNTGFINDGVAIVDSTSSSRTGASGNNDFFGGGERILFMGNDFGDADGTEHTLRFQYVKGGVISHNRMGRNVPDSKAVIKMHNIFDGAPCTQEIMLADNRPSSGGAKNIWGLSPQDNASTRECVRLLRIERNLFEFSKSNGHRQLQLQGGDSLVANNIFDLSGSNPSVRPHGVDVRKRTGGQVTAASNNRIVNNTCYMSDSRPGVKCVVLADSNNHAVNNLVYAPRLSSASTIAAENQAGSGNVLSGNRIASGNPFDNSSPGSPFAEEFKLGSGGTSMIDAGSPLPVALSTDFSGENSRVAGSRVDVGAFEDRGQASGLPSAPTLLND